MCLSHLQMHGLIKKEVFKMSFITMKMNKQDTDLAHFQSFYCVGKEKEKASPGGFAFLRGLFLYSGFQVWRVGLNPRPATCWLHGCGEILKPAKVHTCPLGAARCRSVKRIKSGEAAEGLLWADPTRLMRNMLSLWAPSAPTGAWVSGGHPLPSTVRPPHSWLPVSEGW